MTNFRSTILRFLLWECLVVEIKMDQRETVCLDSADPSIPKYNVEMLDCLARFSWTTICFLGFEQKCVDNYRTSSLKAQQANLLRSIQYHVLPCRTDFDVSVISYNAKIH